MFKHLLKSIIIISAIFFSFSTYATEPTTNLFAIGSYDGPGAFEIPSYPWIITSSNQGQTWSYWNEKPAESTHSTGLLSASCNGDNCVAVGYYNFSSLGDKFPAVTVSHDGGKTWSYSSLDSNQLHTKTFPRNVSCNNQLCAMAGVDYNGKQSSSMLAISKDNGSTWSYPYISNLPLDYNLYPSSLDLVDCSTGNCIVTGEYRKPFLIVNIHEDNKWTYQKIPFPIDPVVSKVSSLKCHDSLCVIGGYYKGLYYNNPFMLKSTDKGKTWSFIKFPQDVKGGISKVECRENECLAVGGFYLNKYATDVAVSHDGGLTWNYPKIQAPNGGVLNGIIYLLNMNDDNYMVAGWETRELGDMPILLMSKDRGETWNYINSITPEDIQYGYLHSISCKKNICLATGDYRQFMSDKPCISCPYLKISYNYGQDWTMPADVLSKMPNDYSMNGHFGSLPTVFSDDKRGLYKP